MDKRLKRIFFADFRESTQKYNRAVLSCMSTSLIRSFDFRKGILQTFTANERDLAQSTGKQRKIQETHAFSALFACLRDCAHRKNRPDFGTTRSYDIEPRLVGKLVKAAAFLRSWYKKNTFLEKKIAPKKEPKTVRKIFCKTLFLMPSRVTMSF